MNCLVSKSSSLLPFSKNKPIRLREDNGGWELILIIQFPFPLRQKHVICLNLCRLLHLVDKRPDKKAWQKISIFLAHVCMSAKSSKLFH